MAHRNGTFCLYGVPKCVNTMWTLNQCFCFQNKIIRFLDTSIQKILFWIIKLNNFRDNLTGISARSTALNTFLKS